MNLESKTIEELKVIAYDLMASLEQTQRNLQAVNQMIAKKYEDANKVEDGTEKP
jgi:hypothetical protein